MNKPCQYQSTDYLGDDTLCLDHTIFVNCSFYLGLCISNKLKFISDLYRTIVHKIIIEVTPLNCHDFIRKKLVELH